ncbi:hypothetical protein G7054_g11898 [Neopestalotiopsis clavispora]|nr:hypothetical protein G7054_g11898 [Neopestalotiopsis clavispora]
MERALGARARYRADHEATTKLIVPNVSRVSRMEGDGEFTCTYNSSLLRTTPALEIQLVPQHFGAYPNEHYFLVFACNGDVPPCVAKTLQDFVPGSYGLKVQIAVACLAERLTASLERDLTGDCAEPDEEADSPMASGDSPSPGSDHEEEEFGDVDWEPDSDDDAFGLASLPVPMVRPPQGFDLSSLPARVLEDFRAVREGGFLVSRLTGFDGRSKHNIVCISVRVDKLCLSKENLSAWNLEAIDFIILLIDYEGHYIPFEHAVENRDAKRSINFRLRKCTYYKPTLEQAYQTFGIIDYSVDPSSTHIGSDKMPEIDLLSVGDSIDILMRGDYIALLKLRYQQKLTWDDAKKVYARSKGHPHVDFSAPADTRRPMPTAGSHQVAQDTGHDTDDDKLPAFIAKEHVESDNKASLPLIAAQFALRHFYMNMGLGPSIDLEVLKHPNVVDLLISFCWAALTTDKKTRRTGVALSAQTLSGDEYTSLASLREYPDGLNLMVPGILSQDDGLPELLGLPHTVVSIPGSCVKLIDPISGIFNPETSIMTLGQEAEMGRFRSGADNWVAIVVSYDGKDIVRHGYIDGIVGRDVFIKVQSGHLFEMSSTLRRHSNHPPSPAYLVHYNLSVDDLPYVDDKARALLLLLTMTPSIGEMREYLKESPKNRLEKWNRINVSVYRLIRWIIASNRSSIVQVDNLATSDEEKEDEASLARPDEKISGVGNMIQFRFAQGSPEKEIRFNDELKTVTKPQKTILAWHGSSLENWHSITRSGLDFKVVKNGRAFGNGVYLAKYFHTSLGYSNRQKAFAAISTSSSVGAPPTGNRGGESCLAESWPGSKLRVQGAISLNEIVNKPSEFITASGGNIYVVNQAHLIQCRYLFVQSGMDRLSDSGTVRHGQELQVFPQDPENHAMGADGRCIVVPMKAIPSTQANEKKEDCTLTKKNAMGHGMTPGKKDEDEEAEDFDFLFKDPEIVTSTQDKALLLLNEKTDFRPGTLDHMTLPQLAPPSYATPMGQKAIGQEIKKLQKLQATTPLHELGWYIDFDQISNMFHWIVELHSFDSKSPLAKDMKKAGATSVVLEVRFGREFPMSPPFLRVVRPRFLPFLNGGGGHVTVGGAMCMQLLTTSGWSPALSMESVLLSVRLALLSEDPRPARLALTSAHSVGKDYSISEAYDAFTRAAHAHGWEVPKDLQETTAAMMRDLSM